MSTILPFSPERPKDAIVARPASDEALFRAAQALEASFLSHMLTSAGLGRTREWGGGGPGEEHFASFLVEEQARSLTAAGGIGLAEQIFAAMAERMRAGE